MNNKITLVTPPDDILLDGKRILLVDLSQDQSKIVSDSLTAIDKSVIVYIWKSGDDLDWLFDKKHKQDLLIFNAESQNELVVGYLAAQKNSYYFGILKSLQSVNKSAIYNTAQCSDILLTYIEEEK